MVQNYNKSAAHYILCPENNCLRAKSLREFLQFSHCIESGVCSVISKIPVHLRKPFERKLSFFSTLSLIWQCFVALIKLT